MRVFISYRRNDSPEVAGRIRDRLVKRFAKKNVYYDVDSIPYGVDFRRHVDSMVRSSDVLLVVIGPQWLETESGLRRIDDPSDFVRIEVEAALQRNIRVVPTLVRGADLPLPEQLPEAIRALVFRNSIRVRQDPDFHGDVTRLINSLTGPSVPDDASERPPLRRYWRWGLAAVALLVAASSIIWLTAVRTGSLPDGSAGMASTGAGQALSARTFAVSQEFSTAADPRHLEVDGDDLLVSFASGMLQRIDPASGSVANSVNFNYSGGNDTLVKSDEIAVTLYDGSRVGFVDPEFRTSEMLEIADGKPLNGTVVPDGFWFACHNNGSGYLLHVVGRKEVGRVPIGFDPDSIWIDGRYFYVTSGHKGIIGKVDIETGSVQTVNIGDSPVGLVFNNGFIWVALAEKDEVAVLDPVDLSVKARHPTGDRPWKLGVGLGSLWVTNSPEAPGLRGSVSRLDPGTGERQQPDIVVGVLPDELAIGDGKVYVANRGSNSLSIISPDSPS